MSKQNILLVKDVDALTDCVGSRNVPKQGTRLKTTMNKKREVVSDGSGGNAQRN